MATPEQPTLSFEHVEQLVLGVEKARLDYGVAVYKNGVLDGSITVARPELIPELRKKYPLLSQTEIGRLEAEKTVAEETCVAELGLESAELIKPLARAVSEERRRRGLLDFRCKRGSEDADEYPYDAMWVPHEDSYDGCQRDFILGVLTLAKLTGQPYTVRGLANIGEDTITPTDTMEGLSPRMSKMLVNI